MADSNNAAAAQSTNNAPPATVKSHADVLFGTPQAETASKLDHVPETKIEHVAEPVEAAAIQKAAEEVVVGELKLPKDSILDSGRVSEIAAEAKAKGLTNEQAQELVNRESEAVSRHQSSLAQKQRDMVIDWAEQSRSDKELGGENFAKNVEIASRGMKKTASPALQEMLDKSGLGNHPEVIKHFLKLGQAGGNDTFHASGANSNSTPKSHADILYGKN